MHFASSHLLMIIGSRVALEPPLDLTAAEQKSKDIVENLKSNIYMSEKHAYFLFVRPSK